MGVPVPLWWCWCCCCCLSYGCGCARFIWRPLSLIGLSPRWTWSLMLLGTLPASFAHRHSAVQRRSSRCPGEDQSGTGRGGRGRDRDGRTQWRSVLVVLLVLVVRVVLAILFTFVPLPSSSSPVGVFLSSTISTQRPHPSGAGSIDAYPITYFVPVSPSGQPAQRICFLKLGPWPRPRPHSTVHTMLVPSFHPCRSFVRYPSLTHGLCARAHSLTRCGGVRTPRACLGL